MPKRVSEEITLEKFKKMHLPKLKTLFIKYPFKNYQLDSIGINKKKMVAYLLGTISGKNIYNFSTLKKENLLGFISLRKLNYLTEHFNFSIHSIRHFLYSKAFQNKCPLLLNYALSNLKGVDVVTSKVASDDIVTIHSLEDNDFNFVGNQIDLILNLKYYKIKSGIDTHKFSIMKKNDLNSVLGIIERVHTINSYAYDPNFNNEAVVRLYQKVTKNSFENNNFITFVYKFRKKVIGFVTIKFNDVFSKHSNKKCASLDFIGVDNKNSGKGIGSKLNSFAINYLKNNNFDICAIKTLSDNYYALRICNKLGFKITSSSLLFHKWMKKV